MKYDEALKLKKGDLVVMDNRSTHYIGMVFEIDDITSIDNWCLRVTLKQPIFNNDFRIHNYDTRRLKRYEP